MEQWKHVCCYFSNPFILLKEKKNFQDDVPIRVLNERLIQLAQGSNAQSTWNDGNIFVVIFSDPFILLK